MAKPKPEQKVVIVYGDLTTEAEGKGRNRSLDEPWVSTDAIPQGYGTHPAPTRKRYLDGRTQEPS
jgi:hypothetical protein